VYFPAAGHADPDEKRLGVVPRTCLSDPLPHYSITP